MIVADLLATLDSIGATVTVTAEGALKVAGPKDVLTEELVAEVRAHKAEVIDSLTWDDARTAQTLRETLARLSDIYRPEWADRLIKASAAWTEIEGRIQAAALVRDMRSFLTALDAYERFARREFLRWEALEREGAV